MLEEKIRLEKFFESDALDLLYKSDTTDLENKQKSKQIINIDL